MNAVWKRCPYRKDKGSEVDGEINRKNRTGNSRIECYYYKNSGDWQKYGTFDFCITLRKRSGSYLLIEVGSPSGNIKRPYEISYGKVIRYDKDLMEDLVKRHPKLFAMMCCKKTTI